MFSPLDLLFIIIVIYIAFDVPYAMCLGCHREPREIFIEVLWPFFWLPLWIMHYYCTIIAPGITPGLTYCSYHVNSLSPLYIMWLKILTLVF